MVSDVIGVVREGIFGLINPLCDEFGLFCEKWCEGDLKVVQSKRRNWFDGVDSRVLREVVLTVGCGEGGVVVRTNGRGSGMRFEYADPEFFDKLVAAIQVVLKHRGKVDGWVVA